MKFLKADNGTRIINTSHITDIELSEGMFPAHDEADLQLHPYRIIAHMTDNSTVELARTTERDTAHDLMNTYFSALNNTPEGTHDA